MAVWDALRVILILAPLAPFPALFLTAALLAFLLDIPTRWLVQQRLPRPLALLLVLGISFGGVVLAALWLLPRLVTQLDELITVLTHNHGPAIWRL